MGKNIPTIPEADKGFGVLIFRLFISIIGLFFSISTLKYQITHATCLEINNYKFPPVL